MAYVHLFMTNFTCCLKSRIFKNYLLWGLWERLRYLDLNLGFMHARQVLYIELNPQPQQVIFYEGFTVKQTRLKNDLVGCCTQKVEAGGS